MLDDDEVEADRDVDRNAVKFEPLPEVQNGGRGSREGSFGRDADIGTSNDNCQVEGDLFKRDVKVGGIPRLRSNY